MMKRNILFALSILLLSSAPQAVLAADDGSLDSMWVEQSDKGAAKTESAPAATSAAPSAAVTESTPVESAPVESKPIESTPVSAATSASEGEDTAAPMCTLQNFKNSSVVSKGGWPGVGPFSPESDNDYADEHHNRLHVDLNGQQITRAQLDLANPVTNGNADKNLVDLQMHIDFFLEAVGIKAAKIQDLNLQLAKHKNVLFAPEIPLNLTAGRCAVTIEKKKGDGKVDYVIGVASLDANQEVLREHSATQPTKVTQPVATSNPPETVVMAPPTVATPKTTSTPAVKTPATGATSTPVTSASEAALKEEFKTLIASWQNVKKTAVRNKSTDELGSVLSGKALARQTDAVKWLTTNHKYYEMNPKGVVVDQLAVLAPAKKYMVAAQVHEAYKFIDEPTGKVLKEVDDINKVNYTVERVNGKWVITDSALLQAAVPGKKTR